MVEGIKELISQYEEGLITKAELVIGIQMRITQNHGRYIDALDEINKTVKM